MNWTAYRCTKCQEIDDEYPIEVPDTFTCEFWGTREVHSEVYLISNCCGAEVDEERIEEDEDSDDA